jgi:hypothetical protein
VEAGVEEVVVLEAGAEGVVVLEAGAEGAAAIVLAEAVTEEEEWGTVVATVRATAAALDLATPALGIRGTTLCQRG